MGEESSRYWHVILNKTFDFSRYQRIADHVKKHTKLLVLRFYDKYIAVNAPCRHKLCVHVVAKQHEEEQEKPAPTTGAPAEQGSSSVEEEEKQPEDANGGTKKEPTAVLIEDPIEFRRTMPLFALPKKTNVDVVDLGINKKGNNMESSKS